MVEHDSTIKWALDEHSSASAHFIETGIQQQK